MNRFQYWIGTFYSYLSRNTSRIIITILIGGISFYLIYIAAEIFQQVEAANNVPKTYIFVKSNTPSNVIALLREKLEKDYNTTVEILTPKEKLKRLFGTETKDKLLLELLPTTIIINKNIPLEENKLDQFKKYLVKITNTPPGTKELKRSVSLIKTFLIFLGVTLGIGMIIINVFTLHLSFMSHREEIKILLLLGADKNFISVPLHLEGLFLGLTSGILGILFVITTIYLKNLLEIPINWFSENTLFIIALPILGIIIGLISSIIGTSIRVRYHESN